jgi:ABC-type antimicrobial peptide transport system permease subunit
MIGIIIGIAAVITIMSLGNGFKKQHQMSFQIQMTEKIMLLLAI